MMRMSFEEALDQLLAVYRDMSPDEIISALELKLYALREERGDEDAD